MFLMEPVVSLAGCFHHVDYGQSKPKLAKPAKPKLFQTVKSFGDKAKTLLCTNSLKITVSTSQINK